MAIIFKNRPIDEGANVLESLASFVCKVEKREQHMLSARKRERLPWKSDSWLFPLERMPYVSW